MKQTKFSRMQIVAPLAMAAPAVPVWYVFYQLLPEVNAFFDAVLLTVLTISIASLFIAVLSGRKLRGELERRARALEISEERHRLLLEQASDAIVVADADTGTIIEANRYASELLGWGSDEMVGNRHSMLYDDGQRPAMRKAFAECIQGGGICEVDMVVKHRLGEKIPLHARGSRVTAGGRCYLQLILRDMRPRLKTEDALRRSEARLRELFDHAPVSILEEDFSAVGAWLESLRTQGVVDLAAHIKANPEALAEQFGRIHFSGANPAALRSAGVPDLRTYIERVPATITPEVLNAFRLELEAIWAGRSEVVCEVTFKKSAGGLGQSLMHWSVPVVDGKLDLARVLVVFSDLSQLRAAEAKLRDVEDRWELALKALNVGIYEQNYIVGETFLSERWKEMLGYAPHELPSRREEWQALIHPEDRERVVAELQAHLRGENDLYRTEYRMKCKDGTYKWILSCGRAIFDREGRPQRLIGSHADISERHVAEDALRESETRYRKLFEGNPCPMWVCAEGSLHFLAVNTAAARHYGYTQEEFLGMTVYDVCLPAEARRLREAPGLLTGGGESAVNNFWHHRRKNGRIMIMRATGHAHEFAGQSAILMLLEDVTERHESEERLRASEMRYRTLFESAVEGVYQTTADGRFQAINPALARMLGYDDPKHMMAVVRSTAEGFYADRNTHGQFQQILGSNSVVAGFESEVRCADGTIKWVSENVRAQRDERGEILQLEGFVSDITGRKHAEQAIRASEERYRVLFEQSPVGIIEYDYRRVGEWLSGLKASGVTDLEIYMREHPAEMLEVYSRVTVVGMNEETVRMARAKSKHQLIENLDRLYNDNFFEARKQAFLAVWNGRNETEGEVNLRAFDGSLRRLYYRWWLPHFDGRDSFEWTQVVLVDITDIRSAESALAAERERLRVTLRAMAEGLLTTDNEGVVQFMNEAAERITGWTAGAAIGRGIEQVCVLRHGKTQAGAIVPVAAAISEHRVVEIPMQSVLVNRQGSSCTVEGRCAPMHDQAGRAIGAVVVFRDITERSRLEMELMRSSKLESVGILAGGIAHDFNNLLTVVMGNVTLAMLDSQVMAAAGRWLEEAERGVMRARDLTQQLLTFAKGGEPVRKAVQLPEVVREAAEFALHGSKVRCEFSVGEDLWAGDVDQAQIGQVVQNLVINAVQAMPEGGVVRITMNNETVGAGSPRPLRTGSYLRLNIADSGMGIRAEHLARIFDPYFTTKQSGSGLGLATVYSIVRKHQGHIEVDSELGRGTVFKIWLPAAPDAKTAQAEAPAPLAKFSGRVLFMDDEETIRMVAKSLLSRLGFDVLPVADGAAAVQAYAEAREQGMPFQLVIMDLTVPGGMGGRDAMQELLKIDPTVRAIVSSGYSSDPVLANYRAHGFRGMVPKPYKLTDLSRTIRIVLDERT